MMETLESVVLAVQLDLILDVLEFEVEAVQLVLDHLQLLVVFVLVLELLVQLVLDDNQDQL